MRTGLRDSAARMRNRFDSDLDPGMVTVASIGAVATGAFHMVVFCSLILISYRYQ